MTQPLTPPDCDLRGMEWMPLFGGRLFTSDFDAHVSDEVFRTALRLWWASWQQQVPAASLPDDDAVLCRLAGLGRDMKTWRRLRGQDVLHGFVKCSDGRLYHKLLAEQAREAWDRRVKDRERKAAYRAKQEAERNKTAPSNPKDVPRDKDGDKTETNEGTDAANDGPVRADKTRQDRTGQDTLKKKDSSELRSDAPAVPPREIDARDILWSEGVEIYRALTGMDDKKARKMVGQMVRSLSEDCAAAMAILHEARDLRPIDPVSWIQGAVKARNQPRNGFMAAFTGPSTLDAEMGPRTPLLELPHG